MQNTSSERERERERPEERRIVGQKRRATNRVPNQNFSTFEQNMQLHNILRAHARRERKREDQMK